MAKKKGRSSGEGTVRTHKSGLKEVRLLVPEELRAALGGRRNISFYGRTEAEAFARREEGRRELLEGAYAFDARKLTVGEYLNRWVEGPLKTTVARKTHDDYSWIVRKYLVPALGKVKLKDLTAEHLDGLYARKVLDGLSPRTVGYIHSTIRVALQRAVKKRLVPYNVARDADPPSRARAQKERQTLSISQLRGFFQVCAAEKDRHEALFILEALTGMRPQEPLGLKWEDLVMPEDPERTGLARIRRRVSKSSAGLEILEGSKTGKMRDVELLPEVVAALKAHRKRYLEERLRYAEIWQSAWKKEPAYEDLVFPSFVGTPTDRDNLLKRHFKPLARKASLPDGVTLYTLRHTFATLWLESDESPKVLQEILGHSRIETTLNVYTHVLPHIQTAAMGRFGRRFSDTKITS